jgi:hypothetical protein
VAYGTLLALRCRLPFRDIFAVLEVSCKEK